MILEDLATLPVTPDYDVPVSDDTYEDSSFPPPIPEGTYRCRIVEWDFDRQKDGSITLSKGNPVLNLKRVEVIEPSEFAGRSATSYQRVYTSTFKRGAQENASGLNDLVRAHDQTAGPLNNTRDAIEILHRLVESGTTFCAKTKWVAFDKDYAEQRFAEQGGKAVLTKDQVNAVYKEAKVEGMKKFPQKPDGSYSHQIIGKSGATIEARGELGTMIPSGTDPKIR